MVEPEGRDEGESGFQFLSSSQQWMVGADGTDNLGLRVPQKARASRRTSSSEGE